MGKDVAGSDIIAGSLLFTKACLGGGGTRFQLRCVLSQPLTVYPGAEVVGELRLVAHKRQSYDIHLRLSVPSLAAGVPDLTVLGSLDNPLLPLNAPQLAGSPA